MKIPKQLTLARNVSARYSDVGFAICRIPSVSSDTLKRIWESSPDGTFEQLIELTQEPLVREALYIASRGFYERLPAGRSGLSDKEATNALYTLYKYIARMSYRPTPFGLSAGVSFLSIEDEGDIRVAPQEVWRKYAQLDAGVATKIASAIVSAKGLDHALPLRRNDSLVDKGKYVYFYQREAAPAGHSSYKYSRAEIDPPLRFVLAFPYEVLSVATLTEALSEHFEVSTADATAYVMELHQEDILASPGLELIGIDKLRGLSKFEIDQQIDELLSILRRQIDDIQRSEFGNLRPYQKLQSSVSSFLGEDVKANCAQVDLYDQIKPNTLCRRDADALKNLGCVALSIGLTANDSLSLFKAAFVGRYQDARVPLAIALDPQDGIEWDLAGEKLPSVINNLPRDRLSQDSEPTARIHPKIGLIYRKFLFARQAEGIEIEFSDREIAELSSHNSLSAPSPESLGVLASIYDHCGSRTYWLRELITGNPYGLLGRFAGGSSELCRKMVDLSYSDRGRGGEGPLEAEIVHIPQSHLGNIAGRPRFHNLEIRLLAPDFSNDQSAINLSDLLVSIVGGRVRLESKRLGREISPIVRNAHNFYGGGNLRLYRFLCLVATEVHGLSGNLGISPLLNILGFTPRIRYRDYILSPARWKLKRDDIQLLHEFSQKQFDIAFLERLRDHFQLPRDILIADGDHRLPLNLDTSLCQEILLREIRSRSELLLEEMVPDPDHVSVIADESGLRYQNETYCVFRKSDFPRNRGEIGVERAPHKSVDLQPYFSARPCTEWAYFKVYIQSARQDRFLQSIWPFIESNRSTFEDWHFLRYRDDETHLRIRFRFKPTQGSHARMLDETMKAFSNSSEMPLGAKVVIDTYQKEVQRYGGISALQTCERIFTIDSDAIMKALASIPDFEQRILFATAGAYDVTRDLLDQSAALKMCLTASESYQSEFGVSSPGRKYIGKVFRDLEPRLKIIRMTERAPLSGGAWYAHLDERREKMQAPLHDLRIQQGRDSLTRNSDRICISLIHMWVNRIFPVNPRLHELFVWEFVRRIIDGLQHR